MRMDVGAHGVGSFALAPVRTGLRHMALKRPLGELEAAGTPVTRRWVRYCFRAASVTRRSALIRCRPVGKSAESTLCARSLICQRGFRGDEKVLWIGG